MSGPTTPFQPIGNNIVNTPVLTTNVNSALGRVTGFGESLRFLNSSGSIVHVRYGTGAQTAVATDTALAVGETRILQVPSGCDNVATFAEAAVSGNVNIQCGAGGL
jgi:hypothetical protein